MLDMLTLAENLPVPEIFIFAGLFFLLLLFVRRLSVKSVTIKILPTQQKLAGIIGTLLILTGVVLYFLPAISAIAGPKSINSTPLVNVSPKRATATPMQSPTDASAPFGGTLALADTLQKNSNRRWDQNTGCRFIENAYYVNATNYYHECAENSDNDFANDAFQVKIVLAKGSSGGIEFRRSANTSYYSFSIGWSGQYKFLKVDSHQTVTTVFQGRIPQNSQQTYVLVVVANKSHLEFYLNKEMVRSQTDTTYTDGTLYLCVDASDEERTPVTQAIFSDLIIWQL